MSFGSAVHLALDIRVSGFLIGPVPHSLQAGSLFCAWLQWSPFFDAAIHCSAIRCVFLPIYFSYLRYSFPFGDLSPAGVLPAIPCLEGL